MLRMLWMSGVALALIVGCGSSHSGGGGAGDGGSGGDAGSVDGGATTCAEGESYFVPGCGSGEEVVITAGCYRPCTGADDDSCPDPLICRRTDINPCVCSAGEGCCAACGAEQWLCLEDPGTDPYELSSLDEDCEGIGTGRDLLDGIEDAYTAPFEYHDATPATELTLGFAYGDGRIVCHPAIPAPPGSAAPDQPASLEVEVTATIATTDGAFDEETTTLLSSWDPGSGAELAARLDATALSGTYEPALSDVTDHTATFGGQLMGTSTSGNAIEAGSRGGGVGETAGIGSWNTGG